MSTEGTEAAGEAEVIRVRFDADGAAPKKARKGGKAKGPAPEPSEAMKKRLWLSRNDLGAARRLEIFADGDLIYCPEKGWLAWDGFRFDVEYGASVAARRAHALHDDMLKAEAEAVRWLAEQDTTVQAEIEQAVSGFKTWAKSCGNAGKIESILKVASSFASLHAPLKTLDPGWDFAVANGVLRLSRDEGAVFDPHPRKADRMTRRALANWNEKATAPAFERFLARVQPDAAQRDYLQRVTGYCLATGNPEQVFFIFQGKGGDGKSTFLNAISQTLGDLVGDAQVQTFLEQDRRGAEASPDIAALAGATRLVRVSEPPLKSFLDEGAIKQFTGGEPVTARTLFKDLFSFDFKATCIMSCNTIPGVRGDDHGIWRRIKVLQWPVSLPKSEQDNELKHRLAAERDGILRWIVAGFEAWLEHGLSPPVEAVEMVDALRRNASPLAEWYQERCELDDSAETPHKVLRADYEAWRAANEAPEVSPKAMAIFLLNRGHKDRKTMGEKVRKGLKLRAAEPVEPDEPAPF